MEACMPVTVALTRSRDAAGNLVVRLGLPLADEYLEFLAGRCRPNTVLAVAYDLKVFSPWARRRGWSVRSMCWRS
jgi:integrase/recombinase XerD